MSWGGCVPWGVLNALCNEKGAKECCAFVNEIHLSEFRDDYVY